MDLSERLRQELADHPRPREADEAKHPWLTILLDTYYTLSTGTALAKGAEEARRRDKVACGPGCVGCCLRPQVPISQLELLGIWWYFMEKLPEEARARLRERLYSHRRSLECPFLMDARCAIYPLRPLACRFLHVFGSPCKHEEIPVESRPRDIWFPGEEIIRPAMTTMLVYFGFATPEAAREAWHQDYLLSVSSLMSDFPWENLATARKK